MERKDQHSKAQMEEDAHGARAGRGAPPRLLDTVLQAPPAQRGPETQTEAPGGGRGESIFL